MANTNTTSENGTKGKGKSSAGTTAAPATATPPTSGGPAPAMVGGKVNPGKVETVKLSDIHVRPGWNMRHFFDPAELASMAESMKEVGQLATIVVTPRDGGGYWLLAGEKRTRAAKLAGLSGLVACIIAPEAAEKAAIDENFRRSDVSMPDRCLFVRGKRVAGMSNEDIAKLLGLRPQTTSIDASIAENLAPDVFNAWAQSPGASKVIQSIYKLPHEEQRKAWAHYKEHGKLPPKPRAEGENLRPSPTNIEASYQELFRTRDHVVGRSPEEDYGFILGALWAFEYMAGAKCDQTDGASPVYPEHIRAHIEAAKAAGQRHGTLFGRTSTGENTPAVATGKGKPAKRVG